GGPEAPPLIDQRAARAVLGRSADDGQSLECDRLAPVQLDRVGDTAVREPSLDAQGYHKSGVVEPGQALDGRLVQMVVVIVRDQDEIDGGKIFLAHRRWRVAADAHEPPARPASSA